MCECVRHYTIELCARYLVAFACVRVCASVRRCAGSALERRIGIISILSHITSDTKSLQQPPEQQQQQQPQLINRDANKPMRCCVVLPHTH